MPDLPLFEDDAPRSVFSRLADWARTEAGGWMIVGVLVALVLVIGAVALIAPRWLQSRAIEPGQIDPIAQSQAAQSALGDLTDLTVAPDTIQDLSPDGARAWNAALLFSTAPNRPARPFIAPPADIQSYGRALDCLTAAVYYEAGAETGEGQAAVAQVVLNRVRHPAYPRTVCGVVFQGSERVTGCQFTFTCDGALARPPSLEGWARARAVATGALNGRVMAQVGTATHYHTDWVAPFWAPKLAKIVQIQTHIFYRWNGAWGLPPAFTGAYVGEEPDILKMAALSTAVLDEPVIDPALIDAALNVQPDIQPAILPLLVSEAASVIADTGENRSEQAAASPAATRPAPPPVRREAAAVPDPLVNPGTVAATAQRQRSRIATPSGW